MISYSAPGKIILSGEHSVVYTKPAFVTAINLKLTFHIDKQRTKQITTIDPTVVYCEKIVKTYLRKNNIAIRDIPYQYTIDSDIPQGCGMGSSAAFCVAAVASFLHFYTGNEYDKETMNSLAYQCEKYFHGMPSGVDVSASCFGGLIFYRKEFEFLKNISALNFKIPKSFQERLVLIDTGKPVESTAEMVAFVGKRYNVYPKKIEHILSAIERVTKRMVVSVVKEDPNMFVDTISENQKLLEELGIVSKQTQKLIDDLKPYGVGKVTGAGGIQKGSGMVLFCLRNPSLKSNLTSLLTQKVMPFIQNQCGVFLHQGAY